MQVERRKHKCRRTLEGKVRRKSIANSQTKGTATSTNKNGRSRKLEKGPNIDKRGYNEHGHTAQNRRTMTAWRAICDNEANRLRTEVAQQAR